MVSVAPTPARTISEARWGGYRGKMRQIAGSDTPWASGLTNLWPAVQVLQLSDRLTLDSWSNIVDFADFVDF